MGKNSRIARLSLTILFASGTAAAIAATTLTDGIFPVSAAVVSAAALSLLLVGEGLKRIVRFLPKKVQRVVHLARAAVAEFFSLIIILALYPIQQTWFDPKKINPNQTPILLVHGYLHNSSGWAYHRYRYQKAGFDNVFTVNLGRPFQSIEKYAEVLRKKAKEIHLFTGRHDIKLVGHSMGGLVAAYYALNLAEKDGIEVKDLVTLGSPLQGTRVAKIGIGECARQMRVGSDFIKALSFNLQNSAIPRFHQGSEADLIIFPHQSAFNGKGMNEKNVRVYKDLSHISFLLSDRVIRANIQRLWSI